MASTAMSAGLADDDMLIFGFDGEPGGEAAVLTGVKRGFVNLDDDEDDDDDDDDEEESSPTKKMCASYELSSHHATTTILNLRSSLEDRDRTIAALKASLDAAKGELERWTSGFMNDSLLPPGATPDPGVVVQAMQKLQASESLLKEQLSTAKRREGHIFMTLATTEHEIVDLKNKLEAAENRVKELLDVLGAARSNRSPLFQQQTFPERTTAMPAEIAVPDISYPPRVPPVMSQQVPMHTPQTVHQEQGPHKVVFEEELPPLEAGRPQDNWEVQPRRPREPTELEKRRAAERALNFQTSNPFVIVSLKPSQVYNGFSINLRSTALPNETGDATLVDDTGNSWICKWLVNGSGKRLSAGWKRFALDHQLEESDVVIFEVVSRESLTLLVHIFRVELDDSTVGLEENSQYYDEGKSPSRRKKRIRPSRAKAGWLFLGRPPPSPPRIPESGANVLPRASSRKTPLSVADFQYPAPQPPRRPVTLEERQRAERAARTLKTVNPSVVVVLPKSSVHSHFSVTIPTVFAKQWLPKALVGVTLCDSAGQKATARWAGNRKSSACLKGFKAFSLTHGLEEGDALVFELMDPNPENPVFLIHVFRVVELSTRGFTSQEFDKDASPLLTDSENDSGSSKSRQKTSTHEENGESNISGNVGASATPSHGSHGFLNTGVCAGVVPLAIRMPETEVFKEFPVSGEAPAHEKHEGNQKTGSPSQ